jgi:ribulose-phosphate 3-epimerase
MKLIAPSILSADFSCLGEEVRAVADAGADWIHIDVMDGRFAPNITIGPLVVEAVKKCTALPLDVHLMIENPDLYIRDFANAGADLISVHVETVLHLNSTVQQIKKYGLRAGVVLNPATPLCSIEWILEFVDIVMIMSVNPGFGGQSFIPNTLQKISALKEMIDARQPDVQIEVDGGVKAQNINAIAAAGADVFVAGSAIFNTDDYKQSIAALKK